MLKKHITITLILIVMGVIFLVGCAQGINKDEKDIAENIIYKLQTQEKLTKSELEYVSQIIEKKESGEELNNHGKKIETETLDDNCGECPQYSPPSQDFCKNGTIIRGRVDECGCPLPPACIRE